MRREEEGGERVVVCAGRGQKEKKEGNKIKSAAGEVWRERRVYVFFVGFIFNWTTLVLFELCLLLGSLDMCCEWIYMCVCVWIAFFQTGATPAYIASQNGEHKCLELLLAAKADVNKARKVRTGYPPSHTPIKKKQTN